MDRRQFLRNAGGGVIAPAVALPLASCSSDYPAEAILAIARKRRCDLIVMASHGRRGLKAFLLGSQTQKVLARAGIPVMVFR